MKKSIFPILALTWGLAAAASADLIGYWDFETDFSDQSGEGNHGTAFGAVTLDATNFVAGAQSMNLANIDDSYLSINDGAGGMNISDQAAFTVAMWVYSTAVQNDKRVFSESSSTNVQPLYNLGTGAGSTNNLDLYRRLPGGGVTNNHQQTTAEPFGDSTWHHIAVVDTGGAMSFYVDGVLDSERTYTDTLLEVDITTFGGIFRGSADPQICCGFNGNLDDIAVWDQALTAGQIVSIFDGTFTPATLPVEATDSDDDGMRDDFEQRIIDADPLDAINTFADVLPGDDFDMDISTNSAEEMNLTDPTNPDTDGDGANDGSETNTGAWMSVADRGTDPLDDDSDNDDLLDGVENPDLAYDPENAATQPGTDPNVLDTDGDGFSDGTEVTNGSDPTDPDDPGVLATFSIDFNSTSQDGGPNPIGLPYLDYNAGHEVDADFIRQEYAVFGTTVGLTPSWPDTTANTTKQMIDRAAGNDNQWLGTGVDLLTDWLGVDTRTSQGGNGDYDGVNGNPSALLLTFDSLPGGTYSWTSYHHDTENIHTPFTLAVSTDGGTTFEDAGQFQMTSSSTGGNPVNPATETGPDPASLSSTVRYEFSTDGAAALVFRFVPLSQGAVHQQLFGINGFDLAQISSNFSKFAITELVHNIADGTVTITWPSVLGQEYTIETSADLVAWTGDLEDGWPASEDEDETSYTFNIDERLPDETEYFIRVKIN